MRRRHCWPAFRSAQSRDALNTPGLFTHFTFRLVNVTDPVFVRVMTCSPGPVKCTLGGLIVMRASGADAGGGATGAGVAGAGDVLDAAAGVEAERVADGEARG